MSKRKSQAHNGVAPLSKHHWITSFQPLPKPAGKPPYHVWRVRPNPGTVFHVIGDTGGIKHPKPQQMVADAMTDDLLNGAVQFCYHLGDVVYFNGEVKEYYSQFYEPYRAYEKPIYAIPGNHDGTPIDEKAVSLAGWCRAFMSDDEPDTLQGDSPRVKVKLPNPYWTLVTNDVLVVGLYTNIPEHGSVDSVQAQWLTHELASAPENKALIVAMHHPVYSFDGHHSGSPAMADLLEHAINDSGRIPNLVLAGHVHNYQRIQGLCPFIVCGNSGYWHLHEVKGEIGDDGDMGDKLIAYDCESHGFLTLKIDSINAKTIEGTYTAIAEDGMITKGFDHFTYPTAAVKLIGSIKL